MKRLALLALALAACEKAPPPVTVTAVQGDSLHLSTGATLHLLVVGDACPIGSHVAMENRGRRDSHGRQLVRVWCNATIDAGRAFKPDNLALDWRPHGERQAS